MKLNVGERLEGAGPALQPGGYVVTSVVRETPWYGLYTGKKVFYNFDFNAKRVRETDEVEWLDVFLRTNRYPILDDPGYIQQRRALARAEVRAILGNRHSNLWPEPLDLLEVENTRDAFAFAGDEVRGGEPIVVYARPSGRFVPDWQKQILPISSILSVLAELLEFMRQAHEEGLLLLGLAPTSLLIDSSDRVHFVGAESVLTQQSPLLKEATPAELWQRLFPPDRFAHGYAAPECFDPDQRPDVRADLYAWGALAYSLLTGVDLEPIAEEQGWPWITLTEAHWGQLERLLSQLPANSLQSWAEQIGIDAHSFMEGWPRKFLTVLRLLLSPTAVRRPHSVEDLLSWLVDPPPPPVAGFAALHTDADIARLLLDCAGMDASLEMAIQCAKGEPPREPIDGVTVAEGPIQTTVTVTNLPLTDEPIFYTVFTRQKKGDHFAYSPGVSALLWQPSEENLRNWIETEAGAAFDPEHPPLRVSMVLGALDLRTATEGLLASPMPRVRAWGLRRVEQALRAQGYTESAEMLLWRFLADSHVELRQSAATALWTYHPTKTDALLVRLMDALEAPPIDAPVPLVQFLRHLQIPEERSRPILERLQARRPMECPLCKTPLTLGERAAHLQAEHGYLLYEGDVLPPDIVFARRWERVFQQQDSNAHEELTGLYLNLPAVRRNQDVAVERYVTDLRRFLLGEDPAGDSATTIPLAIPYASIVAYQTNLRHSRWFLPIARRLLRSEHKRLRDLGCQAVLPHFQEQLRLRASVDELLRLLDSVCGGLDDTDLQIELCRQLVQLGGDQALVSACIEQLQEERLVACAECETEVQAKDLELHLRRAHQIFQFRGERHTYAGLRDAIVHAVCTLPADPTAWRKLQGLAEDKHPGETDRFLVNWIYQHVREMDAELRGHAIAAVAATLVAAKATERFLPYFIGPSKNASWELLGQRIALEICTQLPIPMPLVPLVMPFLDHKELPRRSRENAVLALLRSVGKEGPVALDVLRAYVAQTSKKRGIEKLQQLEQRFGHAPALDAIAQELDGEIRMSCPRCPTELPKRDMVAHLWEKHRLILDGQRVREPWRVIEDWLVDYGLEKDPAVLQRCRELALRDDPHTGLARLHRLLYQRGLRDRDLLIDLRGQVRARKATLCPHCCANVPVEEPLNAPSLTLDETRLKGFGYVVDVSESGLIPSLQIESPDTILYRGHEPGRLLTRLGAVTVFFAPLVGATYALLDWQNELGYPAALIGTMAFGLGLVMSGFLYMIWPNPRRADQRLVKAAWKLLAPEILEKRLGRREWNFLQGLVKITEEVGGPRVPPDVLLECCAEASAAAASDPAARAALAALSRQCIADQRDHGENPYEYVLALTDECFKGKLPLAVLSDLLENFHGPARSAWTKCDLNRLPILLAHQAFAADVDIDDWLNLGRAFPVVNAVLQLEQRGHWLQVYALWQQRGRRPRESAGQAKTLFELANAPREFDDLLSFYPDVLLYVESANLVVGSKGVWIEGVCITAYHADSPVLAERGDAGYELSVGDVKIRCAEDPRTYLGDLLRWLRFYFQEFLPTVSTKTRPMMESRHRMWQLSRTTCPECGKALVPCLGDLGVAIRG